jgi:hypothetical protein
MCLHLSDFSASRNTTLEVEVNLNIGSEKMRFRLAVFQGRRQVDKTIDDIELIFLNYNTELLETFRDALRKLNSISTTAENILLADSG